MKQLWLPVNVWAIGFDCYLAATVPGAPYRACAAVGAAAMTLLLYRRLRTPR